METTTEATERDLPEGSHCDERLLPPGHPDTDDPRAWCECEHDEQCRPGLPCRQRAHFPDRCPNRPAEATLAGAFAHIADPVARVEAALRVLENMPAVVEVLRGQLDQQYAQISAYEQLAGSGGARWFRPDCTACREYGDTSQPAHHCADCRDQGGEWVPVPHGYTRCPTHAHLPTVGGLGSIPKADGDAPPLADALAELRAIVDRTGHPPLRVALRELHGYQVRTNAGPFYDPDCGECNTDAHRCGGCGAPTPHGYDSCPECRQRIATETTAEHDAEVDRLRGLVADLTERHVAVLERARRAETEVDHLRVGTPDPQTERLRTLLVELSDRCTRAWFPVDRQWRNVGMGDTIVGARDTGLWMIDQPAEVDEFTRGKVRVGARKGDKVYPKDVDPDAVVPVLLPWAEAGAAELLRDGVGAEPLGPVRPNGGGS